MALKLEWRIRSLDSSLASLSTFAPDGTVVDVFLLAYRLFLFLVELLEDGVFLHESLVPRIATTTAIPFLDVLA